jgi:hypothetical protein
MIEEGGEVNLLLPFNEDDFIKTSLAFAGQSWVDRFKKIISNHSVQYTSKGGYCNDDELFTFLSQVIYGSAILRSSSTHSDPYLLTVSSEIDFKRKTGGTKDTLDRWPFRQRHININPDIFTTSFQPTTSSEVELFTFESSSENLTYLVYIGCEHKPDEVLTRIEKYKEKSGDETLNIIAVKREKNSFVLAFPSNSGAMEFIDDFYQRNLTGSDETLKIVLHAGTATIHSTIQGSCVDDLKKMGSQVSAGSIFASELIASLLALNIKEFQLQYAGVIKLEDNDVRPFYTIDLVK